MATFQVTRELNPTRCEICHQTDLFDEVSGRCGRCEGVIVPPIVQPSGRTGRMPWWERLLWLDGWRGISVLLFFLAALLFLASVLFPWLEESILLEPESRFRPLLDILEPEGGAPQCTVDVDQSVEVKGLLADVRPDPSLRFEVFSGVPTGKPARESLGSFKGVTFRLQVGADDPDCFLPRIDRLSPDEQVRIQKLLSEKTPVSIEGRWDSTDKMIFVDRIVFRPETKSPPAKTLSTKPKSHSNAASGF